MNLDPKKISAKFNPSLRPFLFVETSIYRQKPKREDPRKIGGISWSDVFPVSSSDFLVFASKVDKTAFDCA